MNKEFHKLKLDSLICGTTTIILVVILMISQNIVCKYSVEERLTKFGLLFILQLVLTLIFMMKTERRLQKAFKELKEKFLLK